MKTTNLTALTVALSLAGFTNLVAQFDSGSTGVDGPLNVTVNTNLDMPTNGVFNFTTINVAYGAALAFNRNPLNTPVFLLATSNVTITGTIWLNGSSANGPSPGAGGPGGFDGGYGGFGLGADSVGGDGQGPGGGKNLGYWDSAAYANNSQNNTNHYGNALISPMIGGSGSAGGSGNPGNGGGGGGGAILIAATTSITVNGAVYCRGGVGHGYGSGGSIRLVAPLVNGGGTLEVRSEGYASAGRIRIDTLDQYAYRSLHLNGSFTRGAQMFVFPASPTPRLDILEAAGQTIPEGTSMPVVIELPIGSPTGQMVVVQGSNFTNDVVPITIAVIPENRASTRYDTEIDMTLGDPATVTNTVTIPDGTITRIQAWTR